MAWTSPRTWVAGAALSAAQLNAHLRDNLLALLPLDAVTHTSYTPTFTQSSTISKTVTYAKWQQIGKLVVVNFVLTASSAGVANNNILVGLPTTAAMTAGNSTVVGSASFFDASAAGAYPAIAVLNSTTTIRLMDATAAVTGTVCLGTTGAAFAAAIASSDVVSGQLMYEAA